MLLALFGVTGIGKSFFAELLAEKGGFQRVKTIRTRARRANEVVGRDGLFLTRDQVDALKAEGKIAYDFSVFGNEYAYLKEDILCRDDRVLEMHYTSLDDLKKIRPDMVSVYLLPTSLEAAKAHVRGRGLSPQKEAERIREMEEQYRRFETDPALRAKFDYVLTNDYDEASEKRILDLCETLKAKADGKE